MSKVHIIIATQGKPTVQELHFEPDITIEFVESAPNVKPLREQQREPGVMPIKPFKKTTVI